LASLSTSWPTLCACRSLGTSGPEATDDDLKRLADCFKVKVDVGTVNKGKSLLRGGLVVNDHGALVGDETAGPELMRTTQVLG